METKLICPSCQKTLPPGVPLGLCPECLIKSGFNTGTEPGKAGKDRGFVPPPVEELRKLFPQLEIIELIGKGGMGAVYKARQPTLDRFVALKILPPGAADDAGFAERFNREARALARLSHPHIVAVHDFGQLGGQPYLVMEFVDGPNLRQVEQAGRLTPEQALEIVPQICEALQFAHNEGVVHRDIKPENILLDKKGRVKITDFGIAKILGVPSSKVSLTGAKDFLGTPHYMAPEQVEKPQTVDHRADIYSLGVVFYELLTGELPLGKFQPPSKKVQIDVRLDEVVLHTLEKEPDRRYQHASEVKTDVETIAHTPGAIQSAGAPAKVAADSAGVEAAWRLVKGPAIGLVITGILNWLAIPLIFLVTAWMANQSDARGSYLILIPLSAFVLSSVMIVAGLKMKRLEAYGLAITGSILAILVTPGNLVGLPIGIWGLVVLSRREVREAFGKGNSHPVVVTASGAPPTPRPDRFWRRFAVAAAAVVLALILIPVGSILLALILPALARARHQAQTQHHAQQANSAAAAHTNTSTSAPQTFSFGPVIERVLEGDEAVDLDSNKLVKSLPTELHEQKFSVNTGDIMQNLVAALTCMRKEGLDLFYSSQDGFFAADMKLSELNPGDWNEPGNPQLMEAIQHSTNITSSPTRLNLGSDGQAIFGFQTREGGMGILQITGFTDNPRGVKIRYKLVQTNSAAFTGSPKLEGSRRKFVRLVVDKAAMTFEGQPTTWDGVDALLENVTDRSNTVLECAVTSDQITVQQQNEWFGKCIALANGLGFEYASFIGIHPLGSKGTPASSGDSTGATRLPAFGPVIERVVSGEGDTNRRFIDFDTGRQFPAADFFGPKAEPSEKETQNWWKQNGIDAVGDTSPAIRGLVGFDMVAVPVTTTEWSMSASRLDYYLAASKPGTPAAMSAKSDLPATFVVKTREGGMGLLQITGFTDSPRGVKIRYKVLMSSADGRSGGESLVGSSGSDAAAPTREGWQLWQGGQPAEAIPKFQLAVKLDPKNTAAWNGLGWASFNSGKTAEAEKAFLKVIELEPGHPAALNGLGQLYLAQKKYAEAESYLLKAAPKAPAAWYGLARLYLLQGKFAEAEKWAQNLVDSGQGDATADKMLQAARDKKLSEGLRLMIEPQ